MGLASWWHWVFILVVVLLLFGGRGKLSGLMGDAAKGIRAFKEGLKGEDESQQAGGALPKDKAERERDEAKS